MTEFAKQEYEDHVYINFDETPRFASFFNEDLDPERIIKELNIFFKKKINPGSTLIVLDEIQECPQALTENFVAIELYDKHFDDLYYWTSEGIAEVDFVFSTEHHIFPIEVKAGFSKKKKSLTVYDEKVSKEQNSPYVLSRASLRNFTLDGKLVNYPLYAISLFPCFRLKITE